MDLPKNERRKLESPKKRTLWLYGAPFSGKTTLADSAPDPLMLNTDGNAVYVTAPFIPIKDEVKQNGRITQRKYAWEVFKDCIETLEVNQGGFKTLVIDLVNDTYEFCRTYMYHKLSITHESDDARGAWDKVRVEYLSNMRRAIQLPFENTILISHESAFEISEKGKDKVTGYKPLMQDKVASSLAGMVGIVGRAYVDGGKHLLSVKSDDTVFGGGRLEVSDVTIPLEWNEIVKLFDVKNGGKHGR